jgi:hypothetical protein
MYDLPNRSLKIFLESPLLSHLSFDQMPTSEVMKHVINRYNKEKSLNLNIAQEALRFYFMDHCFHLVKNENKTIAQVSPQMADLIDLYLKELSKTSQRVFTYIISASLYEAGRMPAQTGKFWEFIETQYGSKVFDVLNNTKGSNWGHLKEKEILKLNDPIQTFLSAIMACFSSGKWWFGAGGKAWSDITRCARDVTEGHYSLQEMTDLAFSLCHDRGCMFDRGIIYNVGGYGVNSNLNIYQVLDIQASGQIPQWIRQNRSSVEKATLDIFDKFYVYFKDEFDKPIDKKLISDSTHKREDKIKQQNQLSQNHHNFVAQNYAQIEDKFNNPPKEKIDEILVDTFKNNKWI